MAMLISLSVVLSVIFKLGSELFTTASTTKTSNCPGFSLLPAFRRSKSSEISARAYDL
jgi:hypothetical protein